MSESEKQMVVIIVFILIICIFASYSIYHSDQEYMKTKLTHQSNYPYSCVVSDSLYDKCIIKGTIGGMPVTWTNESEPRCNNVEQAIRTFENNHVSTIDSNGIVLWKAEGYDSTGSWHQSSQWKEC